MSEVETQQMELLDAAIINLSFSYMLQQNDDIGYTITKANENSYTEISVSVTSKPIPNVEPIEINTRLNNLEISFNMRSAEFKYFCDRWDSLRFNSDGLLTITLAASTNHSERERVICLSALRQELIWDTHKQAHAGAARVTRCLQLQWFWLDMTRDVRLWVQKCKVCQASKHGRSTETAGRRRLHAGRPWQVVAVDLVGLMPTTVRDNNWILVLTDHFTRWADALAIPDESAPSVARALDQQVFCNFGLPEQIHSDQGAQFQSQLMSGLCKMWGVNQSRTAPYHPQGNDVVERKTTEY